ncbi:MAG: hypothetical protein WC795_03230 [Candidatus Paceibacterota bacterium]
MMEEKTITIDPRIFISKPFIECPKCKKKSFGVLMVSGHGYTRRCRECWFSDSFDLPKLSKKVIYLDQFAISEMMKAVNKKLGKEKNVDRFWFSLFEKLERLNKLQLIVCPDSTFHRGESLLFEPKAMKRMYEHFSNGVSFHDPATIRRFQLAAYFRKKVGGEDKEIERNDIIHGRVDKWLDRFHVSVDFGIKGEEIEGLIKSREAVFEALQKVFESWQSEKNKKFKNWYLEEGLAWGKAMAERYVHQLAESAASIISGQNYSIEKYTSFIMSEELILIQSLEYYIPGDKLEKTRKVLSFLQSEDILEISFNEIASSLWAAIAHQAAHSGRKKPPNRGMASDIDMISTLLPYCDAMFIDREMFELLNHGEVKKKISKYKTKIYSASNKKDFMAYLDDIEKSASKEHLKLVDHVYGENWAEPYWSMYEEK